MSIAELLKKQRALLELTKRDVALECGCSEDHIRTLEHGKQKPSVKLFRKLLRALDLTAFGEAPKAWRLLAQEYLPDEIRRHVEIHTPGVQKRRAKDAVRWAKENLDLDTEQLRSLRDYINQRAE